MNTTRLEDIGYALLRFVAGSLWAFHGAQKLFGLFTTPDRMPAVGTQMWFGGLIELAAGALIAVGLFTRWAALLASGTMAVAYFQFHFKLDFSGNNFWPIVNKGELAAIYCFLFLFMAARGAGPASIDRAIWGRR